MSPKIAVLMGGFSQEREISLLSGEGVLKALLSLGHDALAWDPAERPLEGLRPAGVTTAFLVLHGQYGEDGAVQGALELLGIPYTGSGVLASALSMDKILTKRVWSSLGIPTPAFELLTETSSADRLFERLGRPFVVKPAREGSSLGLSKVDRAEALAPAMARARRGEDPVLAEAMIQGREFTVAVLESARGQARALPIIEIQAPQGDYSYQNKYFKDDTQYVCPAQLPEAVAQEMQRHAVAAFQAAGCEGWARVDILWDGHHTPQLLEINTAPGMTSHSLVPMAARAAGLDYPQLVAQVLAGARLKLQPQSPPGQEQS